MSAFKVACEDYADTPIARFFLHCRVTEPTDAAEGIELNGTSSAEIACVALGKAFSDSVHPDGQRANLTKQWLYTA